MLPFIFMNRGTVEDDCGGISLDIILRQGKTDRKMINLFVVSTCLQLIVNGMAHICAHMCLPESRGCGGWYSPEYQTSSAPPTGWKLFLVQEVRLGMEDTTAHKNHIFMKSISN